MFAMCQSCTSPGRILIFGCSCSPMRRTFGGTFGWSLTGGLSATSHTPRWSSVIASSMTCALFSESTRSLMLRNAFGRAARCPSTMITPDIPLTSCASE